jgi:hypothetical protein
VPGWSPKPASSFACVKRLESESGFWCAPSQRAKTSSAAVPYYHSLGTENGGEYVLCWDCMPSDEQSEIIAREATIPGEDRLLG